MALAGKAVMINWSDVALEHRPAYYEWHDREHIAGRVQCEGFLRGRRHLAIDADRDIFNLYEVVNLATLTSAPYRSMIDRPSAETREVSKFIVNAVRALAHVKYSTGLGVGGNVLTVRFEADPRVQTSLEDFLVTQALPEIGRQPGVVGVHLCIADQAASGFVSTERRGRQTQIPGFAAIVEGTSTAALRGAVEASLSRQALLEQGALEPIVTGNYQLQIVVSRAEFDR